MSQPLPEKLRRGRPPSEVARKRVLETAHHILMAEGFGQLTIEAVAAQSGVSKPTIYRSWANATELAMAALVSSSAADGPLQGRDARARLTEQMRSLVTAFATTRGRQVALTLASADPNSEYTKAFRNRVILESREAGKAVLSEAIAGGLLQDPGDLEALLDMIYGPIFYRLLVGHQALDTLFADELIDFAFRILSGASESTNLEPRAGRRDADLGR